MSDEKQAIIDKKNLASTTVYKSMGEALAAVSNAMTKQHFETVDKIKASEKRARAKLKQQVSDVSNRRKR